MARAGHKNSTTKTAIDAIDAANSAMADLKNTAEFALRLAEVGDINDEITIPRRTLTDVLILLSHGLRVADAAIDTLGAVAQHGEKAVA